MAMLLGQCNRAESNNFCPVSNFTLEGSTKVETKTAVLPRGRNFGRKPQKGPEKFCGAGKICGRTYGKLIKKGPKRGRTFL
jgi:hypothetical protein